MPVDLLDRITLDAKIRAEDAANTKWAKKHSRPISPYSVSLRNQIASENAEYDRIRQGTPSAVPASPALRGRGDRAPSLPRASLPRCLVLMTTETLCLGCGARYRSPCATVFAEYAVNERTVLRTQDDIRREERFYWTQIGADNSHRANLLREHQTLTVHAPACEACF